jgi:ribosomal protein L2
VDVYTFAGGAAKFGALSETMSIPFAVLIANTGVGGSAGGAICVNAGATANVFTGSWQNSNQTSARCSF